MKTAQDFDAAVRALDARCHAISKEAHPDITANGYTAAENARVKELKTILETAKKVAEWHKANREVDEIRRARKERDRASNKVYRREYRRILLNQKSS